MIRTRREKLAPPIEQPEDVGRLLEAVRDMATEQGCPSYPALFATAVYTGMRRGELCGLRWTDVDLERRMIVVRRSHGGPTKSGEGCLVPIPSALVPWLAEWKLQQGGGRALVFPNDHAGLWGAEEMHSKDSAARVSRHLADACRRAGLRPIRFHDLRHVYASHFVMSGGDLLTLQRILGHSTPTITGEIYSHLAPSHLVKESDRLRFAAPRGDVVEMERKRAAGEVEAS
jgi:integrase